MLADPMEWQWGDDGAEPSQTPRPTENRYRYRVSDMTQLLILGLIKWLSIT